MLCINGLLDSVNVIVQYCVAGNEVLKNLQFLTVTMGCIGNYCFIYCWMWVTKSGVEDFYPVSEKESLNYSKLNCLKKNKTKKLRGLQ